MIETMTIDEVCEIAGPFGSYGHYAAYLSCTDENGSKRKVRVFCSEKYAKLYSAGESHQLEAKGGAWDDEQMGPGWEKFGRYNPQAGGFAGSHQSQAKPAAPEGYRKPVEATGNSKTITSAENVRRLCNMTIDAFKQLDKGLEIVEDYGRLAEIAAKFAVSTMITLDRNGFIKVEE